MKPKSKLNLEICCNGITSAINAAKSGANRIELCTNLFEGGTTPSIGMIDLVSKIPNIITRVMIRPRGGDFLYSEEEFEVMKKNIEYCKTKKVEGIVLGLLLKNGKIDLERTSQLIKLARPMKVTFHRAFDMCENQNFALNQLIDLKIDTVLTSGGQNKAIDGVQQIKKLIQIADNKIEIMVGSGVRPHNVSSFFEIGIRSFHFSALKTFPSKMTYRNPNISMGNIPQIPEYDTQVSDIEMIQSMRKKLDSF